MKHFPRITVLLGVLTGALMLLPAGAHGALYFDYQRLLDGHLWGLISGHWVHADASHLWWNVTAFVVLAGVIEIRSRQLLLRSLLIGTLCVDLLLLSPLSELQRYCGLSGLLNTLLGVVLYIYWRETRSPAVLFIGALCIAKIALEMYSGQSVFTDISWPPFPIAHLAGILGTPLALRGFFSMRNNHGYLVTSH